MVKGLEKIYYSSDEEWLAIRSKHIGGSDAASIVGLNDWCSPYSVWAEKTGKTEPKEDNERMRQGRDLEAYVVSRFEEKTGKKCKRCNAVLYNPEYPFAHATVDRLIVGEDAGLECKTTSIMNKTDFKGGQYQPSYYCQCQHYMAVTGAKKWYLSVLVLNSGFYVFEIERDEAEIKALMDAEREFWKLVESNTPPEVDGSQSTTDTINDIYSDSNGGEIDLVGFDNQLSTYDALNAQIKAIEEKKKAIENSIKEFLGESEKAENSSYRVSWKNSQRRSFSTEAFAGANPDIDLTPYYKVTDSRVFKITKKKDKEK